MGTRHILKNPVLIIKAPIFRCLFGGDLPGCAVVPKLWRPQADAPGPGFECQPKPPNVGKIIHGPKNIAIMLHTFGVEEFNVEA